MDQQFVIEELTNILSEYQKSKQLTLLTVDDIREALWSIFDDLQVNQTGNFIHIYNPKSKGKYETAVYDVIQNHIVTMFHKEQYVNKDNYKEFIDQIANLPKEYLINNKHYLLIKYPVFGDILVTCLHDGNSWKFMTSSEYKFSAELMQSILKQHGFTFNDLNKDYNYYFEINEQTLFVQLKRIINKKDWKQVYNDPLFNSLFIEIDNKINKTHIPNDASAEKIDQLIQFQLKYKSIFKNILYKNQLTSKTRFVIATYHFLIDI